MRVGNLLSSGSHTMKKLIVVTGASKGIGRAQQVRHASRYAVMTVGMTTAIDYGR